MSDFLESIKKMKKSISGDNLIGYEAWNQKFGENSPWTLEIISFETWPDNFCCVIWLSLKVDSTLELKVYRKISVSSLKSALKLGRGSLGHLSCVNWLCLKVDSENFEL